MTGQIVGNLKTLGREGYPAPHNRNYQLFADTVAAKVEALEEADLRAVGTIIKEVKDGIRDIEGMDVEALDSEPTAVDMYVQQVMNVIRHTIGDEKILEVEEGYYDLDFAELKKVEGVKDLFRGCATEAEWNHCCDMLKKAHNDRYPSGGLMQIALNELEHNGELPYRPR